MSLVVALVLASALKTSAQTTTHTARQGAPPGDSARVCFVDVATRAPIVGVVLAASDGTGRAQASLSDCVVLRMGAWQARRIGYRTHRFILDTSAQTTSIALWPLSLDTVRVSATTLANASAFARMSSTIRTDDARNMGAATTSQLLSRLPFTQQRSARGETGLSLRGARREQVVITLDGMPLNDPSTGVADISDLPLAGIGAATVSLGADPLAAGPGASGGVLALTTNTQRVLSARIGSLGQRSIEGAWSVPVSSTLLTLSVARRVAANDFMFNNVASSTGSSLREQRVNNDEARTAVSLGIVAGTWQLSALASHTDRGMVGAANVRTYDADRARTDRLLLRAQTTIRSAQLSAGVRSFALTYRDPTRSVLNSDARVYAGDMEARGQIALPMHARPSLAWRVGGGRDDVTASGGLTQGRNRAFTSLQSDWRAQSSRLEFGARVDAVGGMGTATVVAPSFSLAAEHAITPQFSFATRAAQALRTPTLYDLYFSSPQRLFVRQLNAERVRLDAEISARLSHGATPGAAQLEVALVARDTRDAIVWFPGNFGWSPANVGEEQLRGAEARARMTPLWGDLSAWGTWYRAELTTGALRIPTPYVPQLSAGAQWMARFRQQIASVQARVMSRRPFSAGPRDRAYELPGVALIDAAWTHPLPRLRKGNAQGRRPVAASLTWSLDNATNIAWQSVRGFPSPGRTWALAFTLRETPQQ